MPLNIFLPSLVKPLRIGTRYDHHQRSTNRTLLQHQLNWIFSSTQNIHHRFTHVLRKPCICIIELYSLHSVVKIWQFVSTPNILTYSSTETNKGSNKSQHWQIKDRISQTAGLLPETNCFKCNYLIKTPSTATSSETTWCLYSYNMATP